MTEVELIARGRELEIFFTKYGQQRQMSPVEVEQTLILAVDFFHMRHIPQENPADIIQSSLALAFAARVPRSGGH